MHDEEKKVKEMKIANDPANVIEIVTGSENGAGVE